MIHKQFESTPDVWVALQRDGKNKPKREIFSSNLFLLDISKGNASDIVMTVLNH